VEWKLRKTSIVKPAVEKLLARRAQELPNWVVVLANGTKVAFAGLVNITGGVMIVDHLGALELAHQSRKKWPPFPQVQT
jgi:hypothetical protein